MNIIDLRKSKKEALFKLINDYNLIKWNKLTWLVLLWDFSIVTDLVEWFKTLAVNFTIKWIGKNNKNIAYTENIKNIEWYDFIISDNQIILNDCKNYWIVWIIYNKIAENNWFVEFNASKSLWNSFIFKNINKWEIFHALIRYLENNKFPYDNKTLIKNLIEK